jgi:hypothetical protein
VAWDNVICIALAAPPAVPKFTPYLDNFIMFEFGDTLLPKGGILIQLLDCVGLKHYGQAAM